MSLEQKLSQAKPVRRGRMCRVRVILMELSAGDRAALDAALSRTTADLARLSSKQISEILASEGQIVSKETIQRHRVGDCNCEPRGETDTKTTEDLDR